MSRNNWEIVRVFCWFEDGKFKIFTFKITVTIPMNVHLVRPKSCLLQALKFIYSESDIMSRDKFI